jgi:hypothetical protein
MIPSLARSNLVALAPLALAPVCSTAEVNTASAEVRSRAAKSSSALPVDNRTASLARLRDAGLGSRLSRRLLVITLSEARLAASSTIQGLVLDIVLGAAVAGRRAAAVEEAVGTSTGTGHATLGVAADVDLGDSSGECSSGGGGLLGCARLHGGGSGLALRGGAREGVEAGLRVAVVDGGSAPVNSLVQCNGELCAMLTLPSILRAALVRSTLRVSILRSAVTSESPRHQRQDSESSETHDD